MSEMYIDQSETSEPKLILCQTKDTQMSWIPGMELLLCSWFCIVTQYYRILIFWGILIHSVTVLVSCLCSLCFGLCGRILDWLTFWCSASLLPHKPKQGEQRFPLIMFNEFVMRKSTLVIIMIKPRIFKLSAVRSKGNPALCFLSPSLKRSNRHIPSK